MYLNRFGKGIKSLKIMFGVIVFLLLINPGKGIVLKDSDSTDNTTDTWQCLEPRHENENMLEVGESVFNCAKKNLYFGLMNNMNSDCVDIGDGVTFLKETDEDLSPRDIFPLGEESATFRGLINAYSNFLSQRGVRWDLGFVYPGLVMRIGPSLNGAGVVDFRLDRRLDYHDRAKLGPGQMIVRRTILPHLLGFRMNLSSLLPILIGIIIFITKNAFIFSKVTLALSVLLTLKSLFLLQAFRPAQQQEHHHHHHPHHPHHPHDTVANDPVDFGDMIITTGVRPRPQGYSITETTTPGIILQMINSLPPYRGINAKNVPKRSSSGQRNFSWEKK